MTTTAVKKGRPVLYDYQTLLENKKLMVDGNSDCQLDSIRQSFYSWSRKNKAVLSEMGVRISCEKHVDNDLEPAGVMVYLLPLK
jgi:hypothetical protein